MIALNREAISAAASLRLSMYFWALTSSEVIPDAVPVWLEAVVAAGSIDVAVPAGCVVAVFSGCEVAVAAGAAVSVGRAGVGTTGIVGAAVTDGVIRVTGKVANCVGGRTVVQPVETRRIRKQVIVFRIDGLSGLEPGLR